MVNSQTGILYIPEAPVTQTLPQTPDSIQSTSDLRVSPFPVPSNHQTDPTGAELVGGTDPKFVALYGIRHALLSKRISSLSKKEVERQPLDAKTQGMAASMLTGSGVLPPAAYHPTTYREKRSRYKIADAKVELMRARLRNLGTSDWAGNSDQNGMPRLVTTPDNVKSVLEGGKIFVQVTNQSVLDGKHLEKEEAPTFTTTRRATLPSDIGTQSQLHRLGTGNYSSNERRAELKARKRYLKDKKLEKKLKNTITNAARGFQPQSRIGKMVRPHPRDKRLKLEKKRQKLEQKKFGSTF